jgi:hypothetical protein
MALPTEQQAKRRTLQQSRFALELGVGREENPIKRGYQGRVSFGHLQTLILSLPGSSIGSAQALSRAGQIVRFAQ